MFLQKTLCKCLLSFVLVGCLMACGPYQVPIKETDYTPIITDRATLEKSFAAEQPRAVTVPGKIYYKDQYLFIVDQFTGVHVYDNHDPASPVAIGFLKIYGCSDIAIKENFLYADNSVDLITLDLSDIKNVREVNRIRNTFAEPPPPDGYAVQNIYSPGKRSKNLIIINWVKKSKTTS